MSFFGTTSGLVYICDYFEINAFFWLWSLSVEVTIRRQFSTSMPKSYQRSYIVKNMEIIRIKYLHGGAKEVSQDEVAFICPVLYWPPKSDVLYPLVHKWGWVLYLRPGCNWSIYPKRYPQFASKLTVYTGADRLIRALCWSHVFL